MPTEASAAGAAAITSDNLKPSAPGPNAAKDAATQGNGRVKVKPLKPYFCSATGEQRSPGGNDYQVEPYQAAELVRNGVAEYADPADEDAAIEARIKAESEVIRAGRRSRGGDQP